MAPTPHLLAALNRAPSLALSPLYPFRLPFCILEGVSSWSGLQGVGAARGGSLGSGELTPTPTPSRHRLLEGEHGRYAKL